MNEIEKICKEIQCPHFIVWSFGYGDCEMFVFDKKEGVSYDIKNTSTDGDNIFLHVSSDTHIIGKTPM